jgi:hypothetical protein
MFVLCAHRPDFDLCHIVLMSVRVHVHVSLLCKADCDHTHVFLINLTVIVFMLSS